MKGTIVIWNEPRGYGFVRPDGSLGKLFIHVTNFSNGQVPRLGAEIEFEIGDPISLGKRPQAVRATILSMPTDAALAALSAAGKDSTGGAL